MEFKEKYHLYLKSEGWASKKLDIIHLRGQKCERCGAKRQLKYLHLHHLTYKRVFDELPKDLELICAGCHVKEHNIKPKKKQKKRKNKFNEYKEEKRILLKKHGSKTPKYYQELQEINRIDEIERKLKKRHKY